MKKTDFLSWEIFEDEPPKDNNAQSRASGIKFSQEASVGDGKKICLSDGTTVRLHCLSNHN